MAKYQVEWHSSYHEEDNIHGTFDTWEDAFQSIHDWWNSNDYVPRYVRYHTTDAGITVIDYGLHYSFYHIVKI